MRVDNETWHFPAHYLFHSLHSTYILHFTLQKIRHILQDLESGISMDASREIARWKTEKRVNELSVECWMLNVKCKLYILHSTCITKRKVLHITHIAYLRLYYESRSEEKILRVWNRKSTVNAATQRKGVRQRRQQKKCGRRKIKKRIGKEDNKLSQSKVKKVSLV